MQNTELLITPADQKLLHIKQIAKMFNGHILSEEEQQQEYKETAFTLLNKLPSITKNVVNQLAGFNYWNWFIDSWSDTIRKVAEDRYIRFM